MEENDLLPWTRQQSCAEEAPYWQELLDTSELLALNAELSPVLEKEQDPGVRPSVAEEDDAPAGEWRPTVSQEQQEA